MNKKLYRSYRDATVKDNINRKAKAEEIEIVSVEVEEDGDDQPIAIHYFPDFIIKLKSGEHLILEV